MKRAFQHGKNKKHDKGGGKRIRPDSDHNREISPRGAQRDPEDGGSESESDDVSSRGMTGVITKLGEIARGQPAGLISFTFRDGHKYVGKFVLDQTVANSFRLKDMWAYTSNRSLAFPFRVGMPVKVMRLKQMPARERRFSYFAQVAIGGPKGPGTPIVLENLNGKEIANLNGKDVAGTVKTFAARGGIATFVDDEGKPSLTHFTVQKVLLSGLDVSESMYRCVIYNGMTVPLKITGSFSRSIPGIYYTADLEMDIPAVTEGEDTLQEPEEFRGVVVKTANGLPVLLSCACKGTAKGEAGNFFVVCESTTVDNGPLSESGLDFSEGTSVVASLRFKRRYPRIEVGRVYSAFADMPLKTGVITKLIYIRKIAFPRSVSASIDGVRMEILIQRSGIKVNGCPSTISFPKDFFKVGMQVQLNDVWLMNNNNYRGTINVSMNILNKTVNIVELGDSRLSVKAKKRKLKASGRHGHWP